MFFYWNFPLRLTSENWVINEFESYGKKVERGKLYEKFFLVNVAAGIYDWLVDVTLENFASKWDLSCSLHGRVTFPEENHVRLNSHLDCYSRKEAN